MRGNVGTHAVGDAPREDRPGAAHHHRQHLRDQRHADVGERDRDEHGERLAGGGAVDETPSAAAVRPAGRAGWRAAGSRARPRGAAPRAGTTQAGGGADVGRRRPPARSSTRIPRFEAAGDPTERAIHDVGLFRAFRVPRAGTVDDRDPGTGTDDRNRRARAGRRRVVLGLFGRQGRIGRSQRRGQDHPAAHTRR